MKKNYRNIVVRNAAANFAAFQTAELAKTKIEIFDDAYHIHFMDNVQSYFDYTELDDKSYKTLARDGDKILDNLYSHYMREWECTLSNDNDIADFVRNYCNTRPAERKGAEM
jgi:hypothetical protein